jgi:hypothetical protein
MALKDLIASTSALTEEAIEDLIKDYARYDVDEKEVAFLPAASKLSGRQKVLVYLVALQGWPIVAKGQEIPTVAKPAHLGDRVGIHGGTLRPLLKDLKDRHLIARKGGAYSVRAASLNDIKAELESGASARRPSKPPRPATAKGSRAKEPPKDAPTKAAPAGSKPKRKAVGKAGELTEKFNGWITEGFFDTPRTLSEVQGRFHEQGDIVPRTSIPSYLLAAVRASPARLARKKAGVGGKDVWVYTKPA